MDTSAGPRRFSPAGPERGTPLRTGFRQLLGLAAYRLVSWALIALCLGMIHGFSGQDAGQSEALSLEVTDVAARFLKPEDEIDRADGAYQQLHRRVRKAAHAAEYALLALVAMLSMAPSRMRPTRQALVVLILCAAFAGYDEWSQSMSPGRGPTILDVGIDALGALAGCLAALFLRWMAVWALRSREMRQPPRR